MIIATLMAARLMTATFNTRQRMYQFTNWVARPTNVNCEGYYLVVPKRFRPTTVWVCGLTIVLSFAVSRAPAASDEPTTPREAGPRSTVAAKAPASAKPAVSLNELNDDLLKGLGPDPLAEQVPAADRVKENKSGAAKPNQKPASPKSPAKPATRRIGDPLDDELLKGLDDGQNAPTEGDESNPLVRLNRQMRQVESLIAQSKLDPATQQLQQKIVHDLEELIKKMQQQKSSSSASAQRSGQQKTARRDQVAQPGAEQGKAGTQNADQPAKDSSTQLRQRQAQRPDLDQLQDLLGKGVWGQLPPKVRDQMLQSSIDQFLPKYELLIEEYFKAIATAGQNKP